MTQTLDRGAIARMLMQLFEHWQLETVEQLNSLGLSTNNRGALTRYRKGAPLSKNRDLLDRAGHLLGIHKNLRLLFPHDRNLAYAWMKTRNKAFENLTPIEVICVHGFAGLLRVRTYLDNALMETSDTKARYSLSELMAQCDPNAPVPDDIKVWNSMVPVGKEW